ncbi:DUF2142 domain-containing protein [Streptococcus massiliensis]|uniref:Membrane protein n=1 Tax=Streptococcus massiliensis TaxID=313439 RepID=A0A380KUS0_9STRE|nr:DUF2142 domain-containing protein [Streptococcus massiliensis]SUN75663.1 membrane protein [Streptococcus massiliensis]
MKLSFEKIRNIVISILLIIFCQLTINLPFKLKLEQNFWFIVIGVVLYFIITDFHKKEKLAKNAFFLILIFGSVVALNRPVQYGLDEETHLENAIGISDSLFFKYSKEDISDYDAVLIHDGIRNQKNFQGDDYWYSVEHKDSKISGKPIGFDNPAYIPGMIGWNLGRLISNKVYVSYYLGRIFHVLAYALLVFFAIKLGRAYKELIYLLGTLPSTIYIISSYHYDYLYFGMSLLLIALLTNILSGYTKITNKIAIAFQAMVLPFAFAKFPFVLAGSLLSILSEKYYETRKVRWLSTGLFFLNMLFALLFAGFIRVFDTTASVAGERPSIFYFIRHPFPVIRTLLNAPSAILDNFVSRPLQYIAKDSPLLITMTAIFFVVCLFVISIQTKVKLSPAFKLFTVSLFIGIAALLAYAMTGDPRVYTPGSIWIGGVQGRYYFLMITFLPLFLGDFLHRKFEIRPFSEQESNFFTGILQYGITFLVIFTMGVALYTQI